ncbi:MAG: response regulator [Oligoflexales bacterium]|nr:response regulator [Oligoflexales bacterium]
MNEESFALELQNTFLAEAQEMLEETETAFMQIEADPDDAGKIDKIFRLVHTLKGSAHVAGFTELGSFAHTFETLLSSLRERKIRVNTAVVDVLLAGNDCLKQFVNALKQDKSAMLDTTDIERSIKACLPDANLQLHDQKDPRSEKLELPELIATETDFTDTEYTPPHINIVANKIETPVFLICDDEPNILSLLEDYLMEGGYKVVSADSAIKALDIFRSQHIDVIFTDLKMPDMNGLEFVTAVRAINELVPIAIVSGNSSREHFKEYIRLGVDAFIEKPFEPNDILSAANRAIRERQLREAVLSLSRLSFRAYVSIEKILSLIPNADASSDEKSRLDNFMQEIRLATNNLLASEKALKR